MESGPNNDIEKHQQQNNNLRTILSMQRRTKALISRCTCEILLGLQYKVNMLLMAKHKPVDHAQSRRVRALFHEHVFFGKRPIVTETMANYLRSHIATKSVKETMPKNLC